MFSRNCPECDRLITYSRKDGMIRANKNNNLCSSCCRTGKRNHFYKVGPSEACRKVHLKVMSGNQHVKGHVMSPEQKEYLSKLRSGSTLSEDHKLKISQGIQRYWTKYRESLPPQEAPWTLNQLTSWARKIKKRDGYVCQECGDTESTMHAHHILPKSLYPDLVFSLENGITLCWPCHKGKHKTRPERD